MNNESNVNNQSPLINNAPTMPVPAAPPEPMAAREQFSGTTVAEDTKKKKKFPIIVIIILGIILLVGGYFLVTKVIMKDKKNVDEKGTIVENVKINGHSCIDNKCDFYINDETYNFSAKNLELFQSLNNYADYIILNIYYRAKDDKKTIVDYEIFDKNKVKLDAKTEDELRGKLGLYPVGEYSEEMTLVDNQASPTYGYDGDIPYTYYNYYFENSDGNSYKFKYRVDEGKKKLDLEVGKKYKVSFKVEKDVFEYTYIITNIE